MVGIRFGGGPDEILTSCIITPPYINQNTSNILSVVLQDEHHLKAWSNVNCFKEVNIFSL